jgi:hypothetical protein
MAEYLTLSHLVAALLGAVAVIGFAALSDLFDNSPPTTQPRSLL